MREAAPPGATVHLLARGVIVRDGRLLVARFRGANHTFLPGGHIEHGESAPAALARELMEELHVRAGIGAYRGALEHTWVDGGVRHFEINHCFEVTVPELASGATPRSHAEHLEFHWVFVGELRAHNLQPPQLWTLIPGWLAGDRAPWWGSTLP